MLKLVKSKNKKRLCCRLKVSTICTNLQKMETLCQHSPLNKDTNKQWLHRALLLKPNLHTTAPSEKAVLKAPQTDKPIKINYFRNHPIKTKIFGHVTQVKNPRVF